MNTDSTHNPKATILVIDDTHENLRLLWQILKGQGYDVRIAPDGMLGLTSARTNSPDVILLDIVMPDINGYEVCRQLKSDKRTRNIPVIFISALDEVVNVVEAFQCGGTDYIIRPFRAEEVLARVKNQVIMQHTKQALREERDRSQSYLKLAGVMFISLDIHANVTMINRKGCEILQWSQEDIIGKNWITHFLPLSLQPLVQPLFGQIIRGEISLPEHDESLIVTRSGEERIISWHNTLLQEHDGTITGILSSGEDITERKRTEAALVEEHARFQRVIEQSDQGFVIVNEHDMITYANQQAYIYLNLPMPTNDNAILSQEPFLELVQKHYHCHPHEAWQTWDHYRQATDTDRYKNQPVRYLVRPETPYAHALWLQVDLLDPPVNTHAERLIRFSDVTEQMTRERHMWTFHALISHKLNTPMSCLINSLYLLQTDIDQCLSPDIKEFATIALESAQQLHSQISRIRHFLTAPDLAQPGQECPLSRIPKIVAHVQQELNVQHIYFSGWDKHDAKPLVLSEQAIALIFRQILENAKKFHPTQSPTIHIVLSVHNEEEACIHIRDDGATLTPEQMERVWTPYYQIEKNFSGQVPGMGLGLAIVASLLWSVGGRYSIANCDPSPGVKVEIIIPFAKKQPWDDVDIEALMANDEHVLVS